MDFDKDLDPILSIFDLNLDANLFIFDEIQLKSEAKSDLLD